MFRSILRLLTLLLAAAASASAQFPQTLRLEATSPAIVSSAPTRAGWQYTITVTGTYSMWPPYDSYGVDAGYVYDVPQEEVLALRWPPEVIYPIPHWVGDTLEVPPFTIPGMQFKFRTRDNIGFRYNGQPLADRGLAASHRYQTTLIGDGRPIEFQILDSAFNIRQGRIVPRYEDNSGALTILVEERPFFNLCDVSTFCQGGQTHLAIAASMLEYDSTGRPTNVLKDPSQLAVVVDGTILQADSISCMSRTPVAYTLVIDRSGSMKFPYDGATNRLEALKRAAHGFLKTMKPQDQAMLITFSYDDDITLDVAWTSDTARLGRGIDAIDPVGGTAWRDATYIGLDYASKHYNPLKAVVLLTDGDDTHSRRSIEQVVSRARGVNVPVFAIGMALVDSSERPLRYLAAQSNGRFFQARDQRAIDSAFNALSQAIESDDCCTLYVALPRTVTSRAGVKTFEIVARDGGGLTALQSYDVYVSDSCSGVSSAPLELASTARVTVSPNPVSGSSTIAVTTPRAGALTVELVSAEGRVERLVSEAHVAAGTTPVALDGTRRPSGVYVVRVIVDGVEAARETVVFVR
jgi:Mg-chelatase subunit ChlD